jgi:hypothetical protein
MGPHCPWVHPMPSRSVPWQSETNACECESPSANQRFAGLLLVLLGLALLFERLAGLLRGGLPGRLVGHVGPLPSSNLSPVLILPQQAEAPPSKSDPEHRLWACYRPSRALPPASCHRPAPRWHVSPHYCAHEVRHYECRPSRNVRSCGADDEDSAQALESGNRPTFEAPVAVVRGSDVRLGE